MGFGINDDWSFELAFIDKNPDVMVFCYDHSISKDIFRRQMFDALNDVMSRRFLWSVLGLKLSAVREKLAMLKYRASVFFRFSHFVARPNVRFYPKGISSEKTDCFVTFAEAFQSLSSGEIPENSVFVKMDIEQYEFRVLPDLLKFSAYINSLVIEFHDLHVLWGRFVELTEDLKDHFEISHIHGNNWGGLIPNSNIPRVLEITFLKKALIREQPPAREQVTYPIPQLDYPNKRDEEDYVLAF